MSVITKDLGAVTAYAAAVNRGYTGTKEEFETLMASYATVAQQAAESAGNASQSATNASQSAQTAETAKGTAQQAATDAQTAQASAQGYAQSAQQSAQSASQSAQTAESAKNTAVDAVDGFAAGAQQALDSVNQAGINWKSLAEAQKLDAEAWAVGQRDGENVGSSDPAYHNNAKWYAESVSASAQTATEAAQTATAKASEAQASASAAAESARTLTIDATLTQSGQAADAKATGKIREDLTNVYEVINPVNIYNSAMPTTVGWLTETGTVDDTGTGANFATTDYIPVENNTDYIVKNARVGYSGPAIGSRILIALYDAEKNYISGTFQNVVNVSPMQVTFASGNATYLRVSTLPAHLATEPQYGSYALMVAVSSTDTSKYIPYVPTVYENRTRIVEGYGAVTESEYDGDMSAMSARIGAVENDASMIAETVYSKNIYDRNSQLTTGWLTDTGTVDATGSGASFATTDYIPIDKNTDYIIANERMNIPGNVLGSRIRMALYDSEKNYISGSFQNVVGVSPMQVTFASENAEFLRVSTLPIHLGVPTSEFALIVQKGTALDGYTTYWVKHISKLYPQDNILYGKKYVACGDSLTAGDFTGYTDENGKTGVLSDAFSPEYGSYRTYPYWIASRNGMTLVNSGINGSVMAISKEYIDGAQSDINYRSPFSLQRYKDIPADADYITLWFGVNDKDHTYLGTISDTTNETFYGAWNVVLPYLMKNHPKAKIGIIITFGIPDSPYTQAVRDVAEKWGVPYFDFPRDKQAPIIIRNKDTGYAVDQNIVDWKFDKYSVSETNHHPNLLAHELESTCLEAWLRTL